MPPARRFGLETGAQPGQPDHTALTLASASETQPLEAVDQADEAVKDKTPDQVDSAVDQAADKAKDEL